MTVLHQDIGDTSCIRTLVTLDGSRLPSAGAAGADVFDAGFGPSVLHDLGALVVEDQQVVGGLD